MNVRKEDLFEDWRETRRGFEEELDERRAAGDNTRYVWESDVEHFSAWWRDNEFHLDRLSDDDRQWIVDRANGMEV